MAALFTMQELSTLARGRPDAIEPDDALALLVMDLASELVRETAGHPEWERIGENAVPFRAKLISLLVAKRSYTNPDQEVSSGIAGGPSARVLDEAAAGLSLTDAESEELEAMRGDGSSPAGLWTLSTTRGAVEDQSLVLFDYPYGGPIDYGDHDEAWLFLPSDEIAT